MKKYAFIALVFILVLALAACSTNLDQTIPSSTGEDTTAATTLMEAIATDSTVVKVESENQESHDEADDYDWDESGEVQVSLSELGISANSASVKVDGSTATINTPGTYRLSGTLENGSIYIQSASEGIVRLVLDSVSITNSTGPAIQVVEADKFILVLADGSNNTLSDGSNYANASAEDDEANATLFSMADTTITGGGSLVVNANYMDGITSKDGLVISGVNLLVKAVDDGIRGKDYLIINSGTITVDSGGDGLKSNNDTEAERGYILVEDGTITVNAGGDAISAQTDILIANGVFDLTTSGENVTWGETTMSTKGIKGLVSVTIDSGIFTLNTSDDGIHSNNAIVINGGQFTIASGDDGMHADTALTINDGNIFISQSYEGLEAASITINNGEVFITSSDDGINVAGGTDGSGEAGSFDPNQDKVSGKQGGGPGMDMFAGSGDLHLVIAGGLIVMDAGGDGLDSNGDITMSGGTVLVNGPTNNRNGAIDYISSFTISGGTLVAAGSSGMSEVPDTTSTQAAILLNFNSAIQAGTLVSLLDASGNPVFTFAPSKVYQSVAVSMPTLQEGSTYTLMTGGSSSGTEFNGLYSGGEITDATEVTTITLSSIITTMGNRSGMR